MNRQGVINIILFMCVSVGMISLGYNIINIEWWVAMLLCMGIQINNGIE